jgi:VIT1/CCC1 family predicted Fe2+/Mn2+ transporter
MLYSIKEYLHEKAEESRHNETAAYLMFIAGIVFFVGGLLATIYSSDNVKWFVFLPYNLTSNPASFLGLTLTLSGISLSVYGVIVGIFYSRKRAFYIQQLYQAHSFVEKSINKPKTKSRKRISGNKRKVPRKSAK